MTAPTTRQWCRDAARRISRGTSRLTWLLGRRISRTGAERARTWWRGIRRWLGDASGAVDWTLRAGLLLAAAMLARHVLGTVAGSLPGRLDRASWLMWPAAAVWLIAAYRVGRDGWQPPTEPEPEPDVDGEQPVEAAPDGDQDDDEPRQITPEQLAAALHAVGAPHAQFVPLAEHLGVTTAAVREACAAASIPVSGGVRMEGRSVSPGVKAEHFPALSSPTAAPSDPAPLGVVGAGQRTDNSNNNTASGTVVRTPDGALLLIRDDPHNPSRAHVQPLQPVESEQPTGSPQ